MHLTKLKTGLVLGLFMSLMHLVWLLLAVTGVAQSMMDFIFKVHMMNNPFIVQPFDALNAAMLLVLTFVVGFIFGWIFSLLFNMLHKK